MSFFLHENKAKRSTKPINWIFINIEFENLNRQGFTTLPVVIKVWRFS
jgi:hypothetical protein